jgi:phage/plasmid-associated DNA primase
MKKINPETGEEDPDPDTIDGMVPRLTLSPSKAAMAISKYMPMRISATDPKENPKLWRFDGKIWKSDGERQTINLIDTILGDLSYERGLKETLRRIRGISDAVPFDSSPYLFPAQDKVIDLQTGKVHDFRPEDYLTFQYAPKLDNSKSDYRPILWHLCSSLPDPRDVLTALDVATSGFVRLPFEAIVQLIGSGGNGKGIFEKILIALATLDRVATITLAEAKASRFGPGAVLDRDFWILSEVEDVKSTINLLKKVSTGELTDSDTKYGDRVKGQPHVLPILDCNDAVDFGDDSWGRKRRIIKLDFPYTFDYAPGTRRKDPHMEELVTSPEALSGLLKIIAARAPCLCRSRKIYTRKRPEEIDAEYKRQRFSLHFFCEECLTSNSEEAKNKTPDGTPIKLTTDALREEYLEYCKLFNVPVPAEKGQIGRYISEKFHTTSAPTKEEKKSVRYYPGLWISKSAKLAYADIALNYGVYRSSTDLLQTEEGKSNNKSFLSTVSTEEWPIWVIEEIERMFQYIQSCDDPQKISYKDYLKNAVDTVDTVEKDLQITIPENPAVDKASPICRSQDESSSGDPSVDTPIGGTCKHDPDFEKFKAGMAKRKCCLCGRTFPYDLTPYFNNGLRGHICSTCHMQGPPPEPAKPDSQTKLGDDEATAC